VTFDRPAFCAKPTLVSNSLRPVGKQLLLCIYIFYIYVFNTDNIKNDQYTRNSYLKVHGCTEYGLLDYLISITILSDLFDLALTFPHKSSAVFVVYKQL